jgi:hypothetical protein
LLARWGVVENDFDDEMMMTMDNVLAVAFS